MEEFTDVSAHVVFEDKLASRVPLDEVGHINNVFVKNYPFPSLHHIVLEFVLRDVIHDFLERNLLPQKDLVPNLQGYEKDEQNSDVDGVDKFSAWLAVEYTDCQIELRRQNQKIS